MSKLRRGSVVLVAATLAVPLWGVPAAIAEEQSFAPFSAGYFNSDGIRKPDEVAFAPPNVTSDRADGVAPEHLAVAARTGSENKVSFLLFDLLELDPFATVSKAVLTLPLAPNGDGNVSLSPAPEKVVACAAGPEGFGGDDGTSLRDAPERLCDQFSVAGVANADGTAYSFDVTALAQSWLEMNDGVALTSAPDQRSSAFQVVFKPATEATLALSYTPGADSSTDLPPVPSFEEPFVPGDSDAGAGFDSGFSSTPDSGFGAVEEAPLSADVPAAAPEAAAEAPVAAPETASTVPVASTMSTSLTPSTSFWIGLALLAGVLALLSLILGDARIAQAATRQSRLSQALQARERASARSGIRGRSAAFGV